ncbi:hypothetical protein ES703_75133 [subsurface metagenome]
MVAVPVHQLLHPVQVLCPPKGIMRDKLVGMGLITRLIHDVHAQFICQLNVFNIGRVMTGSDTINIEPLHQD